MKKTLTAVLTLVLLLYTMSAAFAEEWTCPGCQTVCTGNFCSNCGTQKPSQTESSSIGNIACSLMDNGDVLVEWRSSTTTGPYSVTYQVEGWSSSWYEESSYTGLCAVLSYLIPDATYTIKVTDTTTGTSNSTTYKVPYSIFREFTTGNRYLELTVENFSLSEIKSDPLNSFEVRTSWPHLKKTREYQGKLVLESSQCYCPVVIVYQQFTLENKYSYRYSTFSLYQDWLSKIEDEYGYIPTGEYTFKLYLDGLLYDYATFNLYK